MRAIALRAVPGVLAAIALGGAFAYLLEPLADAAVPFGVALLFASILAATDPVSVVARFKELGVPKRLSVVMEGESLLNDAVGVVAFTVSARPSGWRRRWRRSRPCGWLASPCGRSLSPWPWVWASASSRAG